MATFYTDPSITLRGMREPEDFLSRFLQLQQLAEAREDRKLRRQESLLRLKELERQATEQEAVRGAFSTGVRPGLQVPAGTPERAGFPNIGVDIPPSIDRQRILSELASRGQGQLVPQVQADFAGQDAAMQKQRLEIAEALTKLETSQLANTAKKADIMGSLAQSVLINPASYPQAKQTAEQLGLVQPGFLPEQFTPEMIPQLQGWAAQAMEVKDMVAAEETKRHNQQTEANTRRGQNITANKPELATVQTVDVSGKPVTRFVRKTEGAEFETPPTADMRNKAFARKQLGTAIDSFQQLGQRVITEKTAIVQRARAAGRSVEAALANDPDYRTYQDARKAIAGSLAVAQQGSRVSDVDVMVLWAPLVPDVFKDTVDSAEAKWKVIREIIGVSNEQGGGPAVGTVQDGFRFKGGNPADPNNWERVNP